MSRKVLVTGGNSGIGFAMCKQLATEDDCHVYLGARSEERGSAAVKSILDAAPAAKVELVIIDVGSDESVAAAAAKLANVEFYGIVNNAGAGLAHGVTSDVIINVNLLGPKRVTEAFLPLLAAEGARIVNVSSGIASSYIAGAMMGKPLGCATAEQKKALLAPEVTWEEITSFVDLENAGGEGGVMAQFAAYGVSKAGLSAYTMLLSREHPSVLSTSCSPGFIDTPMTTGFGAKLSPDQGTVSLRHCLLAEGLGGGFYYGSDAKRSPMHVGRDPGQPEYDGSNY